MYNRREKFSCCSQTKILINNVGYSLVEKLFRKYCKKFFLRKILFLTTQKLQTVHSGIKPPLK